MNNLDIVRAWKDKTYRQSLSAEQQAGLPEHPVGEIELSERELQEARGAATAVLCAHGTALPYTYYLIAGCGNIAKDKV